MFEVSNGTGYRREVRYADAIAFGIWPSHGHAIHGFEIKRSREDLKKELGDPRKGDAIGKYVDHWWLVLDDIKLAEGIEIPKTWGILAPRGQLLRVHRKAPERKATPIDRSFAAAMIRRVTEHWVPKHHHEEFKKNATEKLRAEVERDLNLGKDNDRRMLEDAKRTIANFEEWSGVKITRDPTAFDEPHHIRFDYHIKDIGEAVRAVVEARDKQPRFFGGEQTAAQVLARDLAHMERVIDDMDEAARRRRMHADLLRREIARLEQSAQERQTSGLTNPDGAPSPVAGGDDDPRSGGRGGDAGAHEQDAGLQLRDQRAEVPHGEQAPSDPG